MLHLPGRHQGSCARTLSTSRYLHCLCRLAEDVRSLQLKPDFAWFDFSWFAYMPDLLCQPKMQRRLVWYRDKCSRGDVNVPRNGPGNWILLACWVMVVATGNRLSDIKSRRCKSVFWFPLGLVRCDHRPSDFQYFLLVFLLELHFLIRTWSTSLLTHIVLRISLSP